MDRVIYHSLGSSLGKRLACNSSHATTKTNRICSSAKAMVGLYSEYLNFVPLCSYPRFCFIKWEHSSRGSWSCRCLNLEMEENEWGHWRCSISGICIWCVTVHHCSVSSLEGLNILMIAVCTTPIRPTVHVMCFVFKKWKTWTNYSDLRPEYKLVLFSAVWSVFSKSFLLFHSFLPQVSWRWSWVRWVVGNPLCCWPCLVRCKQLKEWSTGASKSLWQHFIKRIKRIIF